AGAEGEVRQAAADSARDHRDRDRARAGRIRAVRRVRVVGARDVAAAPPPRASGERRPMSTRRVRYLAEMGIPLFALRRAAGGDARAPAPGGARAGNALAAAPADPAEPD